MTTRGESFASIRRIIERRNAAKESSVYEVKIVVRTPIEAGVSVRSITIATFEAEVSHVARARAIQFAKAIDPEFEVSVINVEDEDNRDKAFGLVFNHLPGDAGRKWDGVL